MDNELVKDSLSLLTKSNKYSIETMEYHEGCFGNFWIALKSNISTNIKFVRDRGVMSCSIGLGTKAENKWLDITNVFKILKIDLPSLPQETYGFIAESCKIIYNNEELLVKIKNPVYFKELEEKIHNKNKQEFLKNNNLKLKDGYYQK